MQNNLVVWAIFHFFVLYINRSSNKATNKQKQKLRAMREEFRLKLIEGLNVNTNPSILDLILSENPSKEVLLEVFSKTDDRTAELMLLKNMTFKQARLEISFN